ncbi:ENDD1 protein, partial [Emberiza fucata]|nr:ENDD1 protein [Emberiza fucata]
MLGLLLLQVLASCLRLGHSEVETPFDSCPQFFYAGIPPNDALNPKNPAWICQYYNNSYHYATLYDRDKRIPVYSAYKYRPGSGNRSPNWFVEPQLINTTYSKDMDKEMSIINRYNITPQEIGQSQAINQDYKGLKDLDRGHLSPSGHQSGNNSKWATFTLTNIVPQNSTLNQGQWKGYENQTMPQKTQGCTTTYVITGAVPGNTYIPNGRVNVPSHIWSAACCLGGDEAPKDAWGAIAENNKNEVKVLSLEELEKRLTEHYKGKVTLFNKACPRN